MNKAEGAAPTFFTTCVVDAYLNLDPPTHVLRREPFFMMLYAMFVKRKVCYSALFTNLVWWHTGAVSFPLSDAIVAQLA